MLSVFEFHSLVARFPALQVPQVFAVPSSLLAQVSTRSFTRSEIPLVFELCASESQGV